ncbi:hypothetical protein ABIF63_004878 [Bradyrhizobium japonicum]|uniref:Uncharacterized protein n=1 Tax=Bradyrhizobium japonicum TaxID=375 RepID=A0ABV2RV51_BRAJP|nr:hypothetical protein [Bradyrhizobium japonicum]UQD96011.1 hypothetical protein JEY30_31185 [Bradyrhizobium japonicum]WLB16148.1 hypothetical protein QIH95_29390 [Bradyrhizobium japonicum]
MRTLILLPALAVFVIGADGRLYAQECKPKDFTFQEVEKINFSDISKFSGYSVVEQKNDEQKHQKFDGSGVVYGSPVKLSYEDSKSLSNYLLQKSGFDFARDVRLAIVAASNRPISAYEAETLSFVFSPGALRLRSSSRSAANRPSVSC